jgi:hypothetical protein
MLVSPDVQPELEEGIDVGGAEMDLQPELGEHQAGVEVADHLADPHPGRR